MSENTKSSLGGAVYNITNNLRGFWAAVSTFIMWFTIYKILTYGDPCVLNGIADALSM